MESLFAKGSWIALAVCVLAVPAISQGQVHKQTPEKRVYIVPYTHLDTQWGWTVQDTVNQFLPDTLQGNFGLFEKYPEYVFSFEGAFRYMLIKDSYPEDWQKLKQYVDQGRWFVSGSAIEGSDVNLLTAEALFRQILYGNNFFME
jgi:alpha-mannosidase